MTVKRIGIYLAKHVFQVHGVDSHERAVLKKKLKREQMLAFCRALPPACLAWKPAAALTIGGESCKSWVIPSN